ncbi:hypothetical protein V6Z11_D02G056800 [Gossypium hirsutum]
MHFINKCHAYLSYVIKISDLSKTQIVHIFFTYLTCITYRHISTGNP